MTRAKAALAAAALALAAASLGGCSEYVRKPPEFTTPSSRDDGFKAAVFSDGRGEVDPESVEIGEKVEAGVAGVRQSADEMSSVIDEGAAKLEDEGAVDSGGW